MGKMGKQGERDIDPDIREELVFLNKKIADLEKKNRDIHISYEKAINDLRKKELRYKTLFESGGDAILMMKGEVFTDCNSRAAELFDYPKEEIIGSSPLKFTPLLQADGKDSATKAQKKISEALNGKRQHFDWIHSRRDGTLIDTEVMLFPIKFDDEVILQAVVRDITDRKKSLNQLKLSEEKYRKLFENVQDVFFLTDIRGNLTDISPSIERHTGYPLEELIGTPVHVHFSRKEEMLKFLKAIRDNGMVSEFETEMVDKMGRLFHISMNAHLRTDSSNQIIGLEGSMRDISARKIAELELIRAKEKAEESDRLKSAFLANMSHEIRTPMNGILGFLDLLSEPDLEADTRKEFISVVTKSGERLLATINDIIEMSKIEAAESELFVDQIDLADVVTDLYDFFHPQAVEKGIKLELQITDLPEGNCIISDKMKLDGIITNLLRNAIKFTNNGFIKFGFYPEGANVIFFVEDSGIGIPTEMLDAIFERFTQAETTLSRDHEGSGLGLAISKAYVEALNGSIWVDSTPGAGSKFYFSIPAFKGEESKKPGKPTSLSSATSVDGLRVLVAEDDETGFLYIKAVLESEGIFVIHAKNGEEAVNIFEEDPTIDLVLMDLRMPVMDGLVSTRRIREISKAVPIIAQSAFAFHKDQEMAFQAGCDNYLIKPINKSDLLMTIRKFAIRMNL